MILNSYLPIKIKIMKIIKKKYAKKVINNKKFKKNI